MFYGKTDGHKFAKFLRGAREIRASEVISNLTLIPQDASVCAVHNLVPHLAHRKYIYIWKGIEKNRYNTEYIVIHKGLLDTTQEAGKVPEILSALNQKGYEIVFSDKSLYIFFNPDVKKSWLEKEQGRFIPLERDNAL